VVIRATSVGLAVVALAWALTAGAAPDTGATAPAAPTASHSGEAACFHCHEDVHRGTVGTTCQDCHTSESWSPSTYTLARHATTKFPLTGKHEGAECATCHPNAKLVGQPLECAGCHLDRHRGKLGSDCTECHSTAGFSPVADFDHAGRTGFALTTPHGEGVTCDDCHEGARGRLLQVEPNPGCATCHAPSHGEFGACESCHGGQTTFTTASFDHRSTSFRLERRHSALGCASCHPAGQDAAATGSDCTDCHADIHSGQLGQVCDDCHKPDRWRLVRFDHDAAWIPLRGSHFVTACTSCHTNQRWLGLPRECFGCHSADARQGPQTVPAHVTGVGECEDCHGLWTW
jgi:hypothetical protein